MSSNTNFGTKSTTNSYDIVANSLVVNKNTLVKGNLTVLGTTNIGNVTLEDGFVDNLEVNNLTVNNPISSLTVNTLTVTNALPIASGGTGLTSLGSPNQVLTVNPAGTALYYASTPPTTLSNPATITGTDFQGTPTFNFGIEPLIPGSTFGKGFVRTSSASLGLDLATTGTGKFIRLFSDQVTVPLTTTPSTNTSTGAFVVTGDVGIGGKINLGGTLTTPAQITAEATYTSFNYVADAVQLGPFGFGTSDILATGRISMNGILNIPAPFPFTDNSTLTFQPAAGSFASFGTPSYYLTLSSGEARTEIGPTTPTSLGITSKITNIVRSFENILSPIPIPVASRIRNLSNGYQAGVKFGGYCQTDLYTDFASGDQVIDIKSEGGNGGLGTQGRILLEASGGLPGSQITIKTIGVNTNGVLINPESGGVSISPTNGGVTISPQLTVNGFINATGNISANSNNFASTVTSSPAMYVYKETANEFGIDLGYNAASSRYRTRIFTGNASSDIALSVSHGPNQSDSSDKLIVRGDTGNIEMGKTFITGSSVVYTQGVLNVTNTSSTSATVAAFLSPNLTSGQVTVLAFGSSYLNSAEFVYSPNTNQTLVYSTWQFGGGSGSNITLRPSQIDLNSSTLIQVSTSTPSDNTKGYLAVNVTNADGGNILSLYNPALTVSSLLSKTFGKNTVTGNSILETYGYLSDSDYRNNYSARFYGTLVDYIYVQKGVNAGAGNSLPVVSYNVSQLVHNYLPNNRAITFDGSNLAGNYTWKWPSDMGTAGQILTTDGTSALSWVNSPILTGYVTSVTATSPIISSGGTNPVISISSTPSFGATTITGNLNVNSGNIFASQNIVAAVTILNSGNLALSSTSPGSILIRGGSGSIITLPDATTLIIGYSYTINNNSSNTATINQHNSGSVGVVAAGNMATVTCIGTSSPNGQWDLHVSGLAPNTDWANPGTIGSTTPNTGAFTSLISNTFIRANASNLTNTTSLNPAVYVWGGGIAQYGMDLGYSTISSRYRTRIFAPSNVGGASGDIALSIGAGLTQADFSDKLVIRGDTGFVEIKSDTFLEGACAVAGNLFANSLNVASTTNLNPGIFVFNNAVGNAYGMDLGYNATTAKYRTRIFSDAESGADIALSTGVRGTLQTNYTDRLIVRGDTGTVEMTGNATVAGYLRASGGPLPITSPGDGVSMGMQADGYAGIQINGTGSNVGYIDFSQNGTDYLTRIIVDLTKRQQYMADTHVFNNSADTVQYLRLNADNTIVANGTAISLNAPTTANSLTVTSENFANKTISTGTNFGMIFCGNRPTASAFQASFLFGNAGASVPYMAINNGNFTANIFGTCGVEGDLVSNSSGAGSTTNLNPCISVFNSSLGNVYGMDLGYNATTARYRNRIFVPYFGAGDIALSTGDRNGLQSNYTDRLIVRGDTGNVEITSNATVAGYLRVSGDLPIVTAGPGVSMGIQSAGGFAGIQINGTGSNVGFIDFSQDGTDYLTRIIVDLTKKMEYWADTHLFRNAADTSTFLSLNATSIDMNAPVTNISGTSTAETNGVLNVINSSTTNSTVGQFLAPNVLPNNRTGIIIGRDNANSAQLNYQIPTTFPSILTNTTWRFSDAVGASINLFKGNSINLNGNTTNNGTLNVTGNVTAANLKSSNTVYYASGVTEVNNNTFTNVNLITTFRQKGSNTLTWVNQTVGFQNLTGVPVLVNVSWACQRVSNAFGVTALRISRGAVDTLGTQDVAALDAVSISANTYLDPNETVQCSIYQNSGAICTYHNVVVTINTSPVFI